MPGGDKAAEEPWRMGISYLYHTFGAEFLKYNLPFLKRVGIGKLRILLAAIDRKLNSPLTSSVGRLFDAVAAIIDLVTESTFEAEAPIRLEALIETTDESYSYRIKETVLVDTLIKELVRDVKMNIPKGLIATKFHNTIVAIIVEVAQQIRAKNRISTVVLSGGVFQNRYLLEHTEQRLQEQEFTVYSNASVPANDGGLCLGQLAIAAKRRELGL
jgi:hydrogenase maturation protein HypF